MRTRHVLWLWTVLAVVVLALSVEAATRDTARRALALKLVLPESHYVYAKAELPAHARGVLERRFDTTPRGNRTTDAGATLGRVLFYDPLLSSSGTVSCASCHEQARAFADRRSRSKGVHGKRGRRNAMSLVNLRFHPTDRYFWDQRAGSLEEQVLMPIQDPLEMAMTLAALPDRVRLRPEYGALFRDAFGDAQVTNDRIARALAQFVRSLLSFRSRYDAGLARTGDVSKDFPNFTKLENEGKALFFGGRGGGRCASCHVADGGRGPGGRGRRGPDVAAGPGRGPTTGGGTPALFVGRFPSNNGLDRRVDVADRGIGRVTGDAEEIGVFKAPSLRNIELTAPYMHDGRLKTLEAVIDHYNRKVEPHPNLDRRLQGRRGGGTRRLDLTSRDRRALVAFLETLTDRAFTRNPRFSNPFR